MDFKYVFYGILLVVGIILIIYSIRKLLKFKNMIKTEAIVLGKSSIMGRDAYVTKVEFNVNGVVRECDLNTYSVLWRKGQKIKIYYNPNKYWEIDCLSGNILVLILGILFFIGSLLLFLIM